MFLDVSNKMLPFLHQLATTALAEKISNGDAREQEMLFDQLSELSTSSKKELFLKLDLNLDLEISGTWIHDEDYWKRRYLHHWQPCLITEHGNSWKQAFFEKMLSCKLESFNPATDSASELRRFLTFSRKYIQTIEIGKLPSHVDLELVFDCLGNGPSDVKIKYGPNDVGMDYERALFGMKLLDSRSLARVLQRSELLTSLDVSNNLIDDDKARALCSGLLDNISLTYLNLSKNKISDRGARAIAKILETNSILMECDLSDNFIYLDGARAISRALKSNQSLTKLNLRLNGMGDEGCAYIFKSLASHPQLKHLNVAANNAAENSAHALCNFLRMNSVLQHLNVSSNSFHSIEDAIYEALQDNAELLSFEIICCSMREDCCTAIEELILNRQEQKEIKRLCENLA